MEGMVNFDALQEYVDISDAARRMLSKPEKEIHFILHLKTSSNGLIEGGSAVPGRRPKPGEERRR